AADRWPQETAGEGPTRFTEAAVSLLREGEYQGNVRELEAAVEYGYLMARAGGATQIGPEHVPAAVRAILRYRRHGDPELNRVAVERSLEITGGNVKAAAKMLGVSRTALSAFCAALASDPR